MFSPVHIIETDRGGRLLDYYTRYKRIRDTGTHVEVRGSCESACTLMLSIPRPRVCFGTDAQLRFHMPRSGNREPAPDWAAYMYFEYPVEVRDWIDSQGGYAKLPIDGYWTLPAAQLWKMGYAKCL